MAGLLMKSVLLSLLVLILPFFTCADDLPLLHLQPEQLDMGSVLEGEEARATLFIRNNSSAMITITDVQTSCGCTVAEPKSKILMPGAFTELEVRIDTTAKQGEVKKWIRVTDSAGHEAKAFLDLEIRPNMHVSGKGKGIFDGKCATCHFDPVIGKTGGSDIYKAACAMCHGENGSGAYAPALGGYDDEAVLQQLISHGTGTPQMPGFAKEQGGPLTQKQVSTLSRWLLSLD